MQRGTPGHTSRSHWCCQWSLPWIRRYCTELSGSAPFFLSNLVFISRNAFTAAAAGGEGGSLPPSYLPAGADGTAGIRSTPPPAVVFTGRMYPVRRSLTLTPGGIPDHRPAARVIIACSQIDLFVVHFPPRVRRNTALIEVWICCAFVVGEIGCGTADVAIFRTAGFCARVSRCVGFLQISSPAVGTSSNAMQRRKRRSLFTRYVMRCVSAQRASDDDVKDVTRHGDGKRDVEGVDHVT